MKIKSLWIQKYQKYENCNIVFDEHLKHSKFQKEIFGNMNILLFSGENGAGKTTILSFITYIFRYIQRYRERFKSDYRISYDIKIKKSIFNVILEKSNMDIYIKINDKKYYIQEYKIAPKKGYYQNFNIKNIEQVTYDKIKKFLPSQVYVLGFDNSYEKLYYASNYIGDRLVKYRPISESYSITSRGNDISLGIAHIYHKIIKNKQLQNMFESLKLKLSSYVDIYVNIERCSIVRGNYMLNDIDYIKVLNTGDIDKIYSDSEIEKYIENCDSKYNKRFRIMDYLKTKKRFYVLNELIDKKIIYINEFYINKNGIDIPIKDMSTGEKSFLFDLFSICSNLKENSLIIWEEPETHLNMKWSKNLIPLLVELTKENNIQWIFSSHSTYMIKNLFQNQIIRLKEKRLETPDFNTFLANDTEIYKRLFEDGEENLFEKKVFKYIQNNDHELKCELLKILGESYLTFMIYKSMEN